MKTLTHIRSLQDIFLDKDILIVADDKNNTKEMINALKREKMEGWYSTPCYKISKVLEQEDRNVYLKTRAFCNVPSTTKYLHLENIDMRVVQYLMCTYMNIYISGTKDNDQAVIRPTLICTYYGTSLPIRIEKFFRLIYWKETPYAKRIKLK